MTSSALRFGRRRRRGQSTVELALCLPLLVLIMLGAVDLARGMYLNSQVMGAARAGLRIGVQADTTDIGDAIRSEPNSAIPNTDAVWGNEGPPACSTCGPQAAANCTGPTTPCGDPKGCADPSTWAPGQTACFAIRPCVLSNTSQNLFQCLPQRLGAWQSRPVPCTPAPCAPGQQGPNGDGLDIVVVYRFRPATLAIASFVPNGTFYLRAEVVGLALYY